MEHFFGSHLSIAGGYWKAAEAAAALGLRAVQIFSKNNNQWAGKPIAPEDAARFRAAVAAADLAPPIAHNSYLINLCATDAELLAKSRAAMAEELRRAHLLGIPHVVAHPGSHGGAGEAAGLKLIAESLDEVFAATADLPTTIALETTAGQGNSLGWRFEHLRDIIAQCAGRDRLTVCLDTCHLFAAGYPLAPKAAYMKTMKDLFAAVGEERVVCCHVNDSKKPLGSRVDRHEHIGVGHLGEEPFRLLLADRRFRKIPLILETAKEEHPETGEPMDAVNLATLRRLADSKAK